MNGTINDMLVFAIRNGLIATVKVKKDGYDYGPICITADREKTLCGKKLTNQNVGDCLTNANCKQCQKILSLLYCKSK